MDTTPELVNELVNLHRLTQTEAVVATVRQGQATNDRIRKELAANAKKTSERLQMLDDAIRTLGGVPDVIGVALGRFGAMAKLALEQAQTLDEALLGDLALEHQLHDRATFAKVLAQTADRQDVARIMQRLEVAHAATIEWITTRLAEVGVGGPPSLAPAPTQAALGFLQRALFFPSRSFAQSVNRSVNRMQELRGKVSGSVDQAAERAQRLAESAGEVVEAGVSAGLKRAEKEAKTQKAPKAVSVIHDLRKKTGVVSADELPVRNYDGLSSQQAATRVRQLRETGDVRTVLAYEAAHKNRRSVVDAGTARVEKLAAGAAVS